MSKLTVVLLTAASLLFAVDVRSQQPLYDEETGQSLFTNIKALQIGDVVTIIIRESSSASSNSKTETTHKGEISGGPGAGALSFFDVWSLDHENKYAGDGKTTRNGSLQAEMTARVVEKLSNGQFRVEGKRTVRINGEFEMITVSGIVRARDVTPSNTVMSTKIADAEIVYEGKGDVGNASSPGLLNKVLDWIF